MNKGNNDYLSKNQPEGEPDFDKINRLNTNLNTRSSPLHESVEETKDWTKPDENGDVDVPDYLMPLLNKLGFQLRFHTISGEGEAITLVRMTSIAEKFFKAHNSAEAKWQLCPKCNGTGQMYINEAMTNPMNTSCRIGYHTCDVCGGGKVLDPPSSHSAEVEKLREALKGIGNSAVYMINHEHQTVINSGLINHILETVNLALSQDALKEK